MLFFAQFPYYKGQKLPSFAKKANNDSFLFHKKGNLACVNIFPKGTFCILLHKNKP
jgi:hypothetical protein